MPDLVNNAEPKLLDLRQQTIGEMAQQGRAPAAKPDNLRLSLGIHKVERESPSPKVVLHSGTLACLCLCMCVHAHMHTQIIKKIKSSI